ncbi:cytochrome P450 [Streptomyces sp. TRM68367]|uniref:cytochrome P450 n=1 Tax=Streptomyces sp. TRM68367 TaxID=2758415 RepID=UPI00165B105C|nr:cytochrome P450 [Streptomyces sp. TRM68367]MBC9728146.1 cytochrome P450 [Streptomyces sp. TRM68367]
MDSTSRSRRLLLETEIEAVVADHLDEMELAGGPADLVQAFALPISAQVIGELLGVPYCDSKGFQRNATTLWNVDLAPERRHAALGELTAYLRDQLRHKRSWPEEDVLSGLATHEELTADEQARLALLFLIAGHETTANMLALGAFALLADPARLAKVRDMGEDVPAAVEELLIHLPIIQHGPDPTRSPAGHLAFGRGVHQCLGRRLARAEIRIALPALLRRFPALRLAVAPEDVPLRSDMTDYGVHELPVTW